jgi:hypothetical protein
LKIDLLRFDINEFAFLNGYSSEKIIFSNDILPILKNLKKLDISHKIAIDVPLSIISNDKSNYSDIISFYKESNADILVLNTDYDCFDLLQRLSRIKIPFLIYSKNLTANSKNNEKYFNDLLNKFIEIEHMNSIMLILDNYPLDFIEHLKKNILIPIISNDNKSISDGFYGKFSSLSGLESNDNKKYINLNDLILGGIKDCITDINKK